MDKKVLAALHQLNATLEAAEDAAENTAVMNAYFVMEQEVDNAAGHCAQALYWAQQKEAASGG